MSATIQGDPEIRRAERKDSARATRPVPARAALLFLWIVSAATVIRPFDLGWIVCDEGTLAQSADRVSQGEVPHRDFDEGYTGGLTYMNALAFRFFGKSLISLRLPLLAFFLGLVPALFALARRAAPPVIAALAAFACVVWTVPNYFVGMPSWYNLFFAVFGACALFVHIETGRLRWIFLSGVCAGLSILVKIIGLYDVAAVLLFLAWREQTLASAGSGGERRRGSVVFAVVKTGFGVAFLFVLVWTFRSRLGPVDVLHFILPAAALTGILVRAEWREPIGPFRERVRGLARLTIPFLAGIAAPIGVFLVAYARAGAVRELAKGVFLRPQEQVHLATLPFPELTLPLPLVGYVLLLVFPGRLAVRRSRAAFVILAVGLAALLAAAGTLWGYASVWSSASTLDVITVVFGAAMLARRRSVLGAVRAQQVFLLLSLAACIGLVQFPFSAPIYFCYAVPFTILALLFLVTSLPECEPVRWAHLQVLAFAIGFAVVYLNPGYVFSLGVSPSPFRPTGRLALPRARLRIDAKDAAIYSELVAIVGQKSRGAQIYAGPEASEIYFLCGKPNLTRVLLEGVSGITPSGDTVTLGKLFERADVKVVVWNHRPVFTHGLWRVYRERLWKRFPHSREVGRFVVMWRD